MARLDARSGSLAPQAAPSGIAVGSDDIGGVVTSSKGPEAGVWVIAETTALPTKFRKIVVTDDRGRFLIPELRNVNYKVWVRGYGLVDSEPLQSMPGKSVALKAVIAPDPKAAAQYYPPNYWYSLMQVPSKDAFPMTVSDYPGNGGAPAGGRVQTNSQTLSQAEWIFNLKRGCGACHQLGDKATREIPTALGQFDSGYEGWRRRIMSGQEGQGMVGGVRRLGYDNALKMFSDWTDRVASGELPPVPDRPQGIERNVVITLWDFDTPKAFVHDLISTDKRKPTQNSYGTVFATEWSSGMLNSVDPVENSKASIPIPAPASAVAYRQAHPVTMLEPSPYWGNETVFEDVINTEASQRDSQGRVWFRMGDHKPTSAFCKPGSSNPFAQLYPIEQSGTDIEYYDPKTHTFGTVDTCAAGQHLIFDDDKDETLYGTAAGGISWVKTRVWDETHDAEKSQGWCPAIIDYNGDGKTGPFTKASEPVDPKLDRAIPPGFGYGINVNPVDHSLWFAQMNPAPGRIVRMVPGANPPVTCMTEVYEPPYHNTKASGVDAYFPEGIDVGTDGVVWAALSGTGELASFDRRKCKVFNGPTATGQQCPEGWTLYPVPGPRFKGSNLTSDFFYYNWVDRFNTFGLGNNISVVTGTNSDSLILFDPRAKKFFTIRVPYPLGFYTRYVDGRIDDPKAGWKGRGLWAANETRVNWHSEGGKGTTSYVAHFQLRPDPLAK